MEDHRLKSFCLVVETRSFSRAAQAKHMTQSAMSRLVKSLEDELGVTLLHRKGKTVLPTPEGRVFYKHALGILADYARMEQDIGVASGSVKGTLRLGASRTPAIHLLPQVLYDFSRANPDMRVDLAVSRTEGVLRNLLDGKIDIGIIGGHVADCAFSTEIIAGDEVVVIAPEDHPLTRSRKVAVTDLLSHPFILPESGSATRELIDDFFRAAGLDMRKIRVRMTIESPELIVQMVESGLGIAFASKWTVFAAVRTGTVKVLNLPTNAMKRHFYLVDGGRREADSNPANTFREFIKGYKFFIPF